jgi:hypothetical protein
VRRLNESGIWNTGDTPPKTLNVYVPLETDDGDELPAGRP